ncbi:sulfatase-like hydrolase/transferase [Lutibacter sp. TH_r2]|uniref:sulfatase-like hydrolase/transferase n=1 Tax=Lutibacter sp. TH_r2 TaxID=3082083 RepID=UPI0029537514|nr:sulfatase-like hydrolase/transferase [Lutibacter sp. TH_r2]MDV7187997.1 sulfatase-like hydrolase/transferase [Lutibacter sp. TH_r2]
MKTNNRILFFAIVLLFIGKNISAQSTKQPNILWILTDDHRYDAVRSFNKMLTGNEMSKLGYVESPQTDRLTEMGTTFINTYCQAQGCAPSRTSMHLGRYPFRSGVYEFEYYNNNAEHFKPTLPEQMESLGYQTLHIGKLGVRIKTVENGRAKPYEIYQTDIGQKTLGKAGYTAWGKDWFYKIGDTKFDKPLKNVEYFVTPEGKLEYCSFKTEELGLQKKGTTQGTLNKYDLIRFTKTYREADAEGGMIVSGVSPRKAGNTRDGFYPKMLDKFLKNENKSFDVGSKNFDGVDPSKPVFCHIGFNFPHTPVLPPADYRERFQKKEYKIPEFDKAEMKTMAKQMLKQVKTNYSKNYSEEDQIKMIQDYYAFCAYGDDLVGQSVDSFIEYSEKHNQEWLIIYVHGDHGWKLHEHGAVSKFTPWDVDAHNPIVVISSDKNKFPAGKVVKNYTEFVDVAPTALAAAGVDLKTEAFNYLDGMDLAAVVSEKAPVRDYVIGESHAVTGPRAYIRTKDYVFSMQTRPTKKRGENMNWALNATYEELDPALYDMKKDPLEVNNVAFDKKYKKVAQQMKEKLINIVLGDNRVEVGWGKKADGTKIYKSNFAPGAHDYKLKVKK